VAPAIATPPALPSTLPAAPVQSSRHDHADENGNGNGSGHA
jgi:hypothetical protein